MIRYWNRNGRIARPELHDDMAAAPAFRDEPVVFEKRANLPAREDSEITQPLVRCS